MVRSSRARPRRVMPLTLLKLPVMKSFVPSGVASTESAPPLPRTGLKSVSTSPVFRLYDATPLRV